jgi:DNA-binding GntR family transcriptional regulator
MIRAQAERNDKRAMPFADHPVLLDVAPLRLDRNRQVAVQLYDWLRGAILDLRLKPGAFLSRSAVAEQLGVSSTPVRDALSRLADESLVEVFPQHATRVALIDLALVSQAHFLRRSIELEVVRTVTDRHNADLLERLQASLARQRAIYGIGDLTGFTAEDQAFHHLMYEGAGMGDLWSLVRSRSGHLDRLRRLHLPIEGKAAAVLHDHEQIVAAIAAGDSDAAYQAVRRHLAGTLANVDDIRRRHPDLIR